ncbi:hypothetical protein PV326_001307, partial [Microctonus aethiopoides]
MEKISKNRKLKRNGEKNLRRIVQQRLMFEPLYWRSMCANFCKIAEELRVEPGQWLRRARGLDRASARFINEMKNDLVEYAETLRIARSEMPDNFSDEDMEDTVDAEDMGILEAREKRRLEAGSLWAILGDSDLSSDFYYDYC